MKKLKISPLNFVHHAAIVIESLDTGTNSNPPPIYQETFSFRWTLREKSLEFSASLGSGIQRLWSVVVA